MLLMMGLLAAVFASALAAATPADTAKAAAGDFIRGDFASLHARFPAETRKKLSTADFASQLGAAAKQLGAFEKFLVAEPILQRASGYSVYIFPAKFANAEVDMQVTIDGKGEVAGLFMRPPSALKTWSPPAYVNPEAFRESDVRIVTGTIDLPGTLTMPKGAGPFPGIVLVHGSGPNDRDESHGPNRAFRDIAQGLASKGVAVLRYDKRTLVYPQSFGPEATILDETVDDATTALGLLRATKGVDPKRVSVLGHSLGGMVAPRIAAGDAKIWGVVILAGNTRPLADLIDEQADYFASLSAKPSDEEKKAYARLHAEAAKIRAVTDATPAVEPIFGAGPAYWRDLRKYSPTATAKQLACRILALQGERDFQVSMKDFAGWKSALAESKNATFKSYPKLNHYFMEGEGRGAPAEYDAPAHVAEAVLDDIAKWALQK